MTEQLSRPAPVLQAMILADEIYVDAATGKKVIAGTFNQLWGTRFPGVFGRPTKAYLNLTDCHGRMRVQLRYIDLQDESVLIESPMLELTSDDPLRTQELILDIPPFPMPHPGQYMFEAYCNGARLGGLRITVSKVEPEAKE